MANRKIGIVKVGTIPQVVHVVIDHLVDNLHKEKNNKVIGIHSNGLNNELIDCLSLNDSEKGTRLCSLSNSNWLKHRLKLIENHDILIVFYNEENLCNYLPLQQNLNCRILMVPINIFNEQDPTVYPLGFDSAINEAVNNIDKVKDTAGSLLFSNKRLFLIKIPGHKAGVFLKSAASALNCESLGEVSNSDIQRVKGKLIEKYQQGKNYALLLLNETAEEMEIKRQISIDLELDFRSVMIEEAQCIGGSPIVSDRIHAIQLAEVMSQWTETEDPSAVVRLVRNNQINLVSLTNYTGVEI